MFRPWGLATPLGRRRDSLPAQRGPRVEKSLLPHGIGLAGSLRVATRVGHVTVPRRRAGAIWRIDHDIEIPKALKIEHEELHAELSALTKAPGRVGEAARDVATLLHPHFVKEEYALPPLGLLTTVAKGTVTPTMRAVLAMTDRLKRELPEMLAEHRTVVAALEKLAEAGQAERRTDAERFAEKLRLHAETEEQVLYPAAILVGEYVKGLLPGSPPAIQGR